MNQEEFNLLYLQSCCYWHPPSARSVVSIRELTSGCLSIGKNTDKNLEGRIRRLWFTTCQPCVGRSISNSDSGFTPSLCLEPLAKHKKVRYNNNWNVVKQFSCFCGGLRKTISSWGPRPHEIWGDNSGLGWEGPQLEILRREFSFSEAGTPCRSSVGSNAWRVVAWVTSFPSSTTPKPSSSTKRKGRFCPKRILF